MAARRSGARRSESGIWRFWPLPHAGYENPEADTHVDFFDDVLSDAGSTPAASTIKPVLLKRFSYFGRSRLHKVSKTSLTYRAIREPDRAVECRPTQVHIPLRRPDGRRALGWRVPVPRPPDAS